MIVELDVKVLIVSYPQQVYLAKINKNDDLQIDVEYSGDPDEYSLYLILFYKLEIVATKRQNFTSFAFQIWDLFSAFESDSQEILLRVSLYDPKFFMPSISTAKVNINFEPLEGVLEVTPTEGESLETVFQIRALGFVDEDTPLSYRFYFYRTEEIYQEERKLGVSPINSRRDFLRDTLFKNELGTRIPVGKPNSDAGKHLKILLMVSVIDSLGAVTNSTIQIKVANKHSSLSQQVAFYEQFYTSSIQSASLEEVRVQNLCLLGMELALIKENGVLETEGSTEYLELKYKVLQDLQSVDQSQLSVMF